MSQLSDSHPKRWLIRTESNHVLGPINHEKLLELLENKSLSLDDELCSGNGYWFKIREKNLLDDYVYNSVDQSFNEVSEALNEFRKREVAQRQKSLNEVEDTKVVSIADLQEVTPPEFPEKKKTLEEEIKDSQKIISANPDFKIPESEKTEHVGDVDEDSEKTRSYKDVKIKRAASNARFGKISQVMIVRILLLIVLAAICAMVFYHSKIFDFLDSHAYAQEPKQEMILSEKIDMGELELKLVPNILGLSVKVQESIKSTSLDCSSYLNEEVEILHFFGASSFSKCFEKKSLNLKTILI